MDQKEFENNLRRLLTAAITGGQMSNAQLIGSLEVAKLNLHGIMANQASQKAFQQTVGGILKVGAPVPPGIQAQ